ncbi:entericidin A/B family lipoprotein [Methylotenera sp. L2L1]|nr:entericidin A/B family lipoprotein [Methylotenera sp. L2L1]
MKKFFFLVMIAVALSACNTVAGIGKDIEKGGEVIQKSAN